MFFSYQVKATAENVNEAVRELPDANLVRYSSLFRLIVMSLSFHNVTFEFWLRFHLSIMDHRDNESCSFLLFGDPTLKFIISTIFLLKKNKKL